MGSFDKIRNQYWMFSNKLSLIDTLFHKKNRFFRKEVLKSYIRHYFTFVKPKTKSPMFCADEAVKWLVKAHEATSDKGVSHGYFLDDGQMRWRPSYPETTGYIISSLIDYGNFKKDNRILSRAIAMAEWETEIQMPSGAVQGGMVTTPDKQKPAVFNTGMVLQGWMAAFRQTRDCRFLNAGRRAADFMVNDMDHRGHYQTHGGFVASAEIKTYNVLCSWALYRFGEDSGEDKYKKAALKNGEATLQMQQPNGWFANCCLTHPEKPLTHTLGYTLQGLLELGVLAGRDEFISAVEKGINPLIQNIKPNGYLAGRFDRNWKLRASYSCLTGSAQIAIVLYRLAQIREDKTYSNVADRMVDFLKALQLHDCQDHNMNGAIAGSFPLLGGYMTAGYPNWATKYFLDALMLHAGLYQQ